MVSILNFPYKDILNGKYDLKPSKQTAKDFIPTILDLLDNNPNLRSLGSLTRYLYDTDNVECAVWLSSKVVWFNSILVEYLSDTDDFKPII